MSSVLVAEAYIWSLGFNIQRYLDDQEESKCATQKFHLHQTPPRNQTNTRLKIGITKLSQMTNNHSWFENVTHSVKSERITFWRRQCSKNPKTQTWSMCLLKRLQCCLLTTFLCKCHAFVRLQSQLSPFPVSPVHGPKLKVVLGCSGDKCTTYQNHFQTNIGILTKKLCLE